MPSPVDTLKTMTERLKALTSGNPAAAVSSPSGVTIKPAPTGMGMGPHITPQQEVANQVRRMKELSISKGKVSVPGTEATKVVQNAPKVDTGTGMGAGLLRSAAQLVGFEGARALAQSAGTPGQSRMSGLGIAGPAPVYQTPFNDVTPEQVAADKARRAGQTDLQRVTGDLSGKDEPLPSTYTVMGVEYDSASGQAIQPDTGKIAPGGYSVPATGTDTSSGDREALRTGTENERMTAWAEANPELAKRVVAKGPKQSGYDAIENVVFEGAEAPEARELTEADMTSYDNLETFKPSEMAARDRQDPIAGRDNILNSYFPGARAPYSEEAFGAKLQDAQVFEGGINPNAAEIAEVDPQEFLRARMSPRNR